MQRGSAIIYSWLQKQIYDNDFYFLQNIYNFFYVLYLFRCIVFLVLYCKNHYNGITNCYNGITD